MLSFGCVPFCVNGALDNKAFELRKSFMEVAVDLSLQPETYSAEEAARIWQGAFDRLNKAAHTLYRSERPQRPFLLEDFIVMEPEGDALSAEPPQTNAVAAGNASLQTANMPPQNRASNELQSSGVGESAASAAAAEPPSGAGLPKPFVMPLKEFAAPLKPLSAAPKPPSSNSAEAAANDSSRSSSPDTPKAPPISGDSPLPANPATPATSGDRRRQRSASGILAANVKRKEQTPPLGRDGSLTDSNDSSLAANVKCQEQTRPLGSEGQLTDSDDSSSAENIKRKEQAPPSGGDGSLTDGENEDKAGIEPPRAARFIDRNARRASGSSKQPAPKRPSAKKARKLPATSGASSSTTKQSA